MKPIEPKPCPFCGEEPSVKKYADFTEYTVGCRNADCVISYVDDADRDKAIAAWNRRARTPLETELVKVCETIDAAIKNELIVSGTPRVGYASYAVPGPDYFSSYVARLRAVLAKANAATGGGVG